jgi:hypothetical protein
MPNSIFRLLLLVLILILLSTLVVYDGSNSLSPTVNKQIPSQWALIIGIGSYKDVDSEKCYADNDARVLSERLRPIFGNDHVNLIVNSEASKDSIKYAIQDWLAPKEGENDLVLLFFAGHGNCEYIQAYDSLLGSHDNDISPYEYSSWLASLESTQIMFIIDMCESGCFFGNIIGNEYVVLAGSTNREKCWQLDVYEHGIFSFYLIEAFSNLISIDINNDNKISSHEIFYYVYNMTESEFNLYPPPSPQHPQYISHYNGDLIILDLQY